MCGVRMVHTLYKGVKSNHIMEMNVPFVTNNKFKSIMSKYKYSNVYDTMICAVGEGGIDACDGDYRGPLFGGNMMVGLTFWRHKCGKKVIP